MSGTTLDIASVGALSGGVQTGDVLIARRGTGSQATLGELPYPVSYQLIPATPTVLGGVMPPASAALLGTTSLSGLQGIQLGTGLALTNNTLSTTNTVTLPAGAPLIGSTSDGAAQAISLDPSLTLTGTTLSVTQSAPSTLATASALSDTDKLPIQQGADDAFDKAATPLQLKSYMDSKRPVSAALLGTTSGGVEQAITLGTNLSLSGTTLNAAGSGGGASIAGFTSPTWLNQGTATATNVSAGYTIIAPPTTTSGNNLHAALTAPPGSTPWTITGRLDCFVVPRNTFSAGLIVQGSNGALVNVSCSGASQAGSNLFFGLLAVNKFSGAINAYVGSLYSQYTGSSVREVCLRVVNDGTNVSLYFSLSGAGWMLLAQQALTYFGAVTGIGPYADSNDSDSSGAYTMVTLRNYEVLNTASPTTPALWLS